MHQEAFEFVGAAAASLGPFDRVVEFGSRNINGTIRYAFTADDYTGVDIAPGPGVDVVADCADWVPPRPVDCVVCCEVFEHTDRWRDMLVSAHKGLRPGGALIVTAAGPGRSPHSASDGGTVQPGEHYCNIDPDELETALEAAGFSDVAVDSLGFDVRAVAIA